MTTPTVAAADTGLPALQQTICPPTILSRRGLVTAAPAAIVAATMPAIAAGAHLDAALLALAEPFDRTWQAYTSAVGVNSAAEAAAWGLRDLPTDDPRRSKADQLHEASDVRVNKACDANREVVEQMCGIQAQTIEGLALKARVSAEHEENGLPELVASIMDDILAMGGAHA